MTEIDLALTARRMIALYGADAELVAAGQAETHADCGEIQASVDWENVAALIAEIQQDGPPADIPSPAAKKAVSAS